MSILTLDDRSPAVVYSAGWGQAGSKLEFNSTTSWTKVAGSTAKVTFRGTSISVYGTVSSGGARAIAPTSLYSVDGGIPKLYTATQGARAQYRVLFFQSAVLPDAVHSLEISHPEVSDPFFLDLFLVSQVPGTSSDPTSASGTASSSGTASITSSLPITNSSSVLPTSTPTTSSTPLSSTETTTDVTTTPPPSPTSTPLSNSSPVQTSSAADSAASLAAVGGERKSNAGAVAGGVIGGIVALFILVLGFIIWRRRRRERMDLDALRFPPSTSWNNGGSDGISTGVPRRSFTSTTNNTNTSMRNMPPPHQPGGSFSGASSASYQQPGQPYGAGPGASSAMYPGGYAREFSQQQMQQQATPYPPSSSNMSYGGASSVQQPPAYGQPPAQSGQRQVYAAPSQLAGAGAYDRYQDNFDDAYGGVATPSATGHGNYRY